jgi:NhaP-type Na+/H+ or K+/H+ antiporter
LLAGYGGIFVTLVIGYQVRLMIFRWGYGYSRLVGSLLSPHSLRFCLGIGRISDALALAFYYLALKLLFTGDEERGQWPS